MSNKKENKALGTGLSNHYGEVLFRKVWCDKDKKHKYIMELDGWSGTKGVDITKKMFDEAVKIFTE